MSADIKKVVDSYIEWLKGQLAHIESGEFDVRDGNGSIKDKIAAKLRADIAEFEGIRSSLE